MATSCEIKQGSRLPPLSATLYISDAPVDLTDALKVEIAIRAKGGAAGTERICLCEILDPPTSGVVSYEWAVEDTETAGKYNLEFHVTYTDGRVLKCPSKGYAQLTVTEDLKSTD